MVCCFNPRLPGGRRPGFRLAKRFVPRFQSTPSGGKATKRVRVYRLVNVVSIHAFRGEGDIARVCRGRSGTSFNPRLPGGRRLVIATSITVSLRVSIHAFRGEGDDDAAAYTTVSVVSIHAFRGEGDSAGSRRGLSLVVSIHAFRGEGDTISRAERGAGAVSIHAFRGEGDTDDRRATRARRGFNPRLPGGRRPQPPLSQHLI